MHSLLKQDDNTWCVIRSEIWDNETINVIVFDKLSFTSALKAVNYLNGGNASLSVELINTLEWRAVKTEGE